MPRYLTNAPRILVSMRHATIGSHKAVATPSGYNDLVLEGGGIPFGMPIFDRCPPGVSVSDVVESFLDELRPDGVLLTGGEDIEPVHYGMGADPKLGPVDPVRDICDLALARAALKRNLGIMSICRGMQLLNVVDGGTLIQDIPNHRLLTPDDRPDPNQNHRVKLKPGSWLARAVRLTEFDTNSYHHQCVKDVGPNLVATGWAEDGTPEVIEHIDPAKICFGVQWHPEIHPTPVSLAIIHYFIELLRKRR